MDPVIDYASPVGRVRLLMGDIDQIEDPRDIAMPPSFLFTDAQIEGFLEIEGGNPKRAAAAALIAIAVNEALILKVIKTDDKQTDGAKVADALRLAARDLRAQAQQDESADLPFAVVGWEPCPADWAWR